MKNDHSLNDPLLQSLEARLAMAAPQASAEEVQRLLYSAAFAAGKRSNRWAIRRWQLTTAAMVVLVAAMNLSFPANTKRMASVPHHPQRTPQIVRFGGAKANELDATPNHSRESLTSPNDALHFDAWKHSSTDALSNESLLARLQDTDLASRTLSVGALGVQRLD